MSSEIPKFEAPAESPERTAKKERLEHIRADLETVTDKIGKPIDEGIKETVLYFNALDFPTSSSCEGHTGEHPEEEGEKSPYVWVETPEPEGWEENEKIKEQWRRENLKKQAQMITLLGKFYENRKANNDARLRVAGTGVGGFRVENQGSDIMEIFDEETQQKKRLEYRDEMFAFTQFLKEKYFSD